MDSITEVERIDGLVAARRCLQAMDETQDVETRVALWRAAGRYMQKTRLERAGLERHRTFQSQLCAPFEEGGAGRAGEI